MIQVKAAGTEKQVAWAIDIVNKPIERAESAIAQWDSGEGFVGLKEGIPAIRRAIAKYTSMCETRPEMLDIRFIIDHKGRFAPMLKEAIRRELVEDGIWPGNYLANLDLYL